MTHFNRIGDAMSTALSQVFEGTTSRSPASKNPRRDGEGSPSRLPFSLVQSTWLQGALQSTFEASGSHVQAELGKIETVAREAKQEAGRALDVQAELTAQHQALVERVLRLEQRERDQGEQAVEELRSLTQRTRQELETIRKQQEEQRKRPFSMERLMARTNLERRIARMGNL